MKNNFDRSKNNLTRQGLAVYQTLSGVSSFKSAQDIYRELKASGYNVGLATVYRQLQKLVSIGLLDRLQMSNGESVYRNCEKQTHHHHLICNACGRSVEFEAPKIEKWALEKGRSEGYLNISHTLEIYGTCPKCLPSSL